MGERPATLSTAILLVALQLVPVPATAHEPLSPRAKIMRIEGLNAQGERDVAAAELGREFRLIISVAGRTLIAQYFVEVVSVVAGSPVRRIAWGTGHIIPPLLCCTVTIPLRLDETLKWREIEFRIWVKDASGRVSNRSTHRLAIHD